MSTLEEWTAALCAEFGLDPAAADTTAVLDLARDVAHGVARPAAPLTAYLVGLAVGRGLALPDAAARVQALAAGWPGERLPDSYGPPHWPGAGCWPAVQLRFRGRTPDERRVVNDSRR